MTVARRPRGRPRDPGADVPILRAALEMFIEHGVEGTSVEQVAKRAGVGKLTVYRRWRHKEELIVAAIESARSDAPPLPPPDGSLVEYVEAGIPVIAETLADARMRGLAARALGTSGSHPQIMAAYWDAHVVPRRTAIRGLLERARADGTLPAHTDPDVLMDMLAGALLYRLTQPEPLDAAGMRRYLRRLYVHAGLLPPTDG